MKVVLKDLHFSYIKSRKVLNGINLDINSKGIIAVVGASGSGKSTLLRIIAGIIQKGRSNNYYGHVLLDGELPISYVKRGDIGFMFQEPTLMPNLTVKQNINFPFRLKGNQINDEADQLLRIIGLEKFADYLPASLSGGMKTRVALARTFVTRSKLLLLDEPFNSLDVRLKKIIYFELEKLRQIYQPTILLVTHDIHEAVHLSNHIIVLGLKGVVLNEYIINETFPRSADFQSVNNLNKIVTEIQNLIINEQ